MRQKIRLEYSKPEFTIRSDSNYVSIFIFTSTLTHPNHIYPIPSQTWSLIIHLQNKILLPSLFIIINNIHPSKP